MTHAPYAVLMAGEAPKYRQIADGLRARIRRGEYAPGAQVPSKTDLMREHHVSLNTVNDAMKVLISEGLIRTVQGLGTFVCDTLPDSPMSEHEYVMRCVEELAVEVRRLREEVAEVKRAQAAGLARRPPVQARGSRPPIQLAGHQLRRALRGSSASYRQRKQAATGCLPLWGDQSWVRSASVGGMTNTALREARRCAHLSQEGLARVLREAGYDLGAPNGCTRELVRKWEAGKVRRPQGSYLLALEKVFGLPVASLGFDADARYGIDRARAITEAGLDSPPPLPEPAGTYGPLSGVWLSSYTYRSSGRDATYTSKHYVTILRRGARLNVRSMPASDSQVSMDLSVNGQVIQGTWAEETERGGYYRGALYTGCLQLLEKDDGTRLAGTWVGFGKEGDVNTGPWSLTLVDEHLDAETRERWNRVPEESP